MEQYLGDVVKEYEKTRHTISDSKSPMQVRQLEALSDFLGPANDASLFKRSVIDPYRSGLHPCGFAAPEASTLSEVQPSLKRTVAVVGKVNRFFKWQSHFSHGGWRAVICFI
jgi:hypothetical protein